MTEVGQRLARARAEHEGRHGLVAGEPSSRDLVELPGREAPTGVTVEWLDHPDGTRLRTARWLASGPTAGTVLVCTGRGEFIEKYFELTRELLARGFAVVAFDWRGQGLSSRALPDRRKGHVDSFASFALDLHAVIERVLLVHCPRPLYALAHSMGGAVMLHHARGKACRFERVVLSAPMIAIDRLPWPRHLHRLCSVLRRVGLGAAFVPQGRRTAVFEHGFEGNLLTTDRRRFDDMARISRAEPALTIDAPTVGWLGAALDAMAAFADPTFAQGLSVPTLTVAPGDDRVVDVAAMERFAHRLRNGVLVPIPGARHEILMERDALRDQFWAAFDAFVPGVRTTEVVGAASLSAAARR